MRHKVKHRVPSNIATPRIWIPPAQERGKYGHELHIWLITSDQKPPIYNFTKYAVKCQADDTYKYRCPSRHILQKQE